MRKQEAEFYRKEIGQSITKEFILGESKTMETISFDDERIKSYVETRVSDHGIESRYLVENELFNKFWPTRQDGEQLLFIVGELGIGKSTLLSFFFRYYLPHKPRLLFTNATESDIRRHTQAFQQHVLLCADVRRPPRGCLRSHLFQRLRASIEEAAAKNPAMQIDRSVSGSDEDWVKANVWKIAQEKNGTHRRWYVTWIIDNVDQMSEDDQVDLLLVVTEYLRQERVGSWATDPIEDIKDAIWRVIMPVRPETEENFASALNPWANKDTLKLGSVHSELLIDTRAKRFREQIVQGGREYVRDYHPISTLRPYFHSLTVGENAERLSGAFVAGHKLSGKTPTTTAKARVILDKLANRSARRRLALATRAGLSESFRTRLKLAADRGWDGPPVSAYFYLDGLIRGDSAAFRGRDEYILNLYDLGARKYSPLSVFVGLHACWLLQKNTWGLTKEILAKIGYEPNDLQECERQLLIRGVINELWRKERSGRIEYRTETEIVEGHWLLLRERAYTDNMAYACAQEWGRCDAVALTEPLYHKDLLPRLNGSLWFMKQIFEFEKSVRGFSAAAQARGIDCRDHWQLLDKYEIPWITPYVAREYLSKSKRFPLYERTQAEIDADLPQWERFYGDLEALIADVERVDRPRDLRDLGAPPR